MLPRCSPLAAFSKPPGLVRDAGSFEPASLASSSRRVRNPSALSLSSLRSAPPVPHRTSLELPCPGARRSRVSRERSYSGLLPCVRRLNHLADWRGTEEPPSAAAADPRLVLLFAPSVTSLGAEPQVISLYVRPPGLPQFPTARPSAAVDFSGQEREAPRYPRARPFSRFGSVSESTHRQALSGLSWLSSSSPRFSSRGRRVRHHPVPALTSSGTPHAGNG